MNIESRSLQFPEFSLDMERLNLSLVRVLLWTVFETFSRNILNYSKGTRIVQFTLQESLFPDLGLDIERLNLSLVRVLLWTVFETFSRNILKVFKSDSRIVQLTLQGSLCSFKSNSGIVQLTLQENLCSFQNLVLTLRFV